jgi:metal-responsive CopG/Arc/MetJ family transcriptional regulator
MGRTRSKVAISIDSNLLDRVERLRAVTGESRSAVVGRALAALTAEESHASKVAAYREAYRLQPETEVQVEAARRHARKMLSAVAWDEP